MPEKPLLIYDGDCHFCRGWILRWVRQSGRRADFLPFQKAAARFPEIPRAEFEKAVQLILPSGKRVQGAEAVFSLLAFEPGQGWALWLYRYLPFFRAASEYFYAQVAAHRVLFSKLSRLLWGDFSRAEEYQTLRIFFTAGMGVIYFLAFISLGSQVLGLIGENGILPAADTLHLVREKLGSAGFWQFPTLLWFAPGDLSLLFLCWGGALLSLLLIAGLTPKVTALFLWVFYLSLTTAGNLFLSFQWDILLLETGFLLILFCPWGWLYSRKNPPPPAVTVILLRLLVFKLMFCSGVVKLSSGDAVWKNLQALNYHYYTQPIPNAFAWYAHHLPRGFQEFSVGVMFVIELVLPFFIFLPRNPRRLACAGLVFLQVLILLTGNYTFFNLLSLLLCMLLLDDSIFPAKLTAFFRGRRNRARNVFFHAGRFFLTLFFVLWLGLSAVRVSMAFRKPLPLPAAAENIFRALLPYHFAGGYGLFARMTTQRMEIIVQGSGDGQEWKTYHFKYKPGDLKRPPPFAAPHQPRLDWQMWFAALGDIRGNPWFLAFCKKVLEGKEPVLELLETNPFSGKPPQYLRALFYEYRFSNAEEKQRLGYWWQAELKGLYLPAISLESFRK